MRQLRRQQNAEQRDDHRDDPGRGPLPAGTVAPAPTAVLDQEGDGAAELAADRKSLQQPGGDDQRRRHEANRRVARGGRHHHRADHHQPDRQGQAGPPSMAVGIGADHRRAERPGQIGEPKRAEGDQQRDGRIAGREEDLRDRHREKAVDQKIEPLEDVADRGGDHDPGQRWRRLAQRSGQRGVGGHVGTVFQRRAGVPNEKVMLPGKIRHCEHSEAI